MLNILRSRFGRRLFLLAPDGNAGGGDNTPAPKSLTLEQQLSKARDDLSAATSQVTTLTAERDTAKSDLGKVTTERDQLRSQFYTLTTASNQLKTDLTAAQSKVTKLTGDLASTKAQLTTADANLTRLEALCGVKGIDSKSVPAATPESAAEKLTYAQWEQKLMAASEGAARKTVRAEFQKAVAEDRIAKA